MLLDENGVICTIIQLRINWRLTSRQSFTVNRCLTRNVEICKLSLLSVWLFDVCPPVRRKTNGLDYSDIDPRKRREVVVVGAGTAAFDAAADQSTESSPATAPTSASTPAAAANADTAAAEAKRKADGVCRGVRSILITIVS
jgi:hypothetical protein